MGLRLNRAGKSLQEMLVFAVIATLCAQSAHAQSHIHVPADERATVLLGAYPTVFLPFGHWRQHPYAGRTVGEYHYPAGMKLFGPGYGATMEIGMQVPVRHGLMRRFTVLLQTELTTLGTDNWEQAAAKAGSDISASATQAAGQVVAGFEFLRDGPWTVEFRAGLGAMLISCSEEYPELGVEYGYDRFGAAFSLIGGVSVYWQLTSGFDLALFASILLGLPGASYTEANSGPYSGSLIALGPRLRFEPLVGAE